MDWRSLPVDLVGEILSRGSAKSVAKLRSTSKQLSALLKPGFFAKTQATRKEESLTIMLMDFRVYLVRVTHVNKDAPSFKVAAQFYFKDPLSNSSQVDISNVFHCDGLLLCTTKDNRLVVWNPCSGETKWIKPRNSYKKSDYYALGYDNKSSFKQYKILRVHRQDLPLIKNEYEIYDFTSNSWRVLGVAIDWFLQDKIRGISIKGITYWVALDYTVAGGPYPEFLLSFDFSAERFERRSSLPFPHPLPYKNVTLSVVGEEHLCLLGTDGKFWVYARPSNDFQVWVATRTGSVMSWSKYLVVEHKDLEVIRRHKFCNGMSFLVDEQKQVVMYLSPKNILHIVGEKKHTQVDSLGKDSACMASYSVLLNYFPSLAQIQQGSLPGGGHKRKAPSTSRDL